MHWATVVADMGRAIALVAAINVPIALILVFLAGRKKVKQR